MLSTSYLESFFDELEKIAATVLMKPLSAAAKGTMERMTGFAHGASIPQAASAQSLRHALTGKAAPQLMTEMHGMGSMLSPAERAARQQAHQHFEGILQRQGKIYKGAPGLEHDLQNIPGHPREPTRTGARMGGSVSVAQEPSRLMAFLDQPRGQPVQGLAPSVSHDLGSSAAAAREEVTGVRRIRRPVPAAPRTVNPGTANTAMAPLDPHGATFLAPAGAM